jgi:hypothetical protein
MTDFFSSLVKGLKNGIETEYDIGLTFITLAFLYLLYSMIISKMYKIPKLFLLLYGIGGIFLIIKNVADDHIYITINELIGCIIVFTLYFYF